MQAATSWNDIGQKVMEAVHANRSLLDCYGPSPCDTARCSTIGGGGKAYFGTISPAPSVPLPAPASGPEPAPLPVSPVGEPSLPFPSLTPVQPRLTPIRGAPMPHPAPLGDESPGPFKPPSPLPVALPSLMPRPVPAPAPVPAPIPATPWGRQSPVPPQPAPWPVQPQPARYLPTPMRAPNGPWCAQPAAVRRPSWHSPLPASRACLDAEAEPATQLLTRNDDARTDPGTRAFA